MNIRTSAFRGLAILSLTALGLAGCKDEIQIPEETPPAPEVVVVPSSVSIPVGGTATAAAVVKNSTTQTVTWSCPANNGVATIDANGKITAVAPGQTVCTATATVDANAKGFVSVTVTAPVVTISVVPTTVSLVVGDSVTLAANVSGSTTAPTWTSSATGVATVAGTGNAGKVKAVGAGTAVITATVGGVSAAAVVTVTPVNANVQITLVPAEATTVVGGTIQLQANVTGATNTAVTYRTSAPTVATVDANGLVTGVSQGTAVITAIAQADTSKKATSTITVQGASVAISSAPTVTQTGPGPFIIVTNVAIPGGSADSLMIRLMDATDTTKVFTWRCQTFTAAGAATYVDCPVDPADYDPYTAGVQILPNGSYILRAILMKNNAVADFAQWGTNIVTNYSNTVRGVITWDNSLVDTDNAADDPMATNAGNVWFGGSATVNLTASIFTGVTLASATLGVDTNCDGTVEASRTVTFTNGTATQTWSEANTLAASTPGIDNVESATVCFIIGPTGLDAGSIAVPLVTGLGNVTVAVAGTNTTLGADQNQFRVDNVEAAAAAGALAFDAADFDGNDGTPGLEVFLGTNSAVSVTASNPTVLNAAGADAGVGGLTYIYYAVPVASYDGTSQSTLRTSAAAGTAFTSPTTLAETLNDTDYVLVVETRDALGNRRWAGGPLFGVDLTAPVLAVYTTGTTLADGAINPAAGSLLQLSVMDIASGAEGIRGTSEGRSVYEIDGNIDEDVRCYDFAGVLAATNPSGGCANQTSTAPVATINVTTEIYQVTLPADENFYTFTVTAFDAAGNTAATTVTRTALVDVTAGPDAVAALAPVTINSYTIDNVAHSATVNGVIRDNIDLASYDARFVFPALPTVPDQLPFTMPVAVGAYGLPLVGEQTVTATTTPNVDGISPTIAGPAILASQFGFGTLDVAGNFAFGGVAIPAGTHVNTIAGLTAFAASESPTTIDRTPPSGGSVTTTVSLVATVGVGDANPFAGGQVFFYYVNPGGNFAYGDADDGNVLYAMVPAATVTIATGETARTYTWTATLSAMNVPVLPAAFGLQVFAVGVTANGDGFMSDVDVVTVNQ